MTVKYENDALDFEKLQICFRAMRVLLCELFHYLKNTAVNLVNSMLLPSYRIFIDGVF